MKRLITAATLLACSTTAAESQERRDTLVLVDSIIVIDSVTVHDTLTVRTALDTLFVYGDTLRVYGDTLFLPSTGSRWRFGVGGGFASLFTFGGGGADFIVPAASLFARHDDRWFITLTGGWNTLFLEKRPPRDQYPELPRAESIVSLGAAFFPKRLRHPDGTPRRIVGGVAFGVRGAWDVVRREDEFQQRAFGIFAGPRLRTHRFGIELALDLQVSTVNTFPDNDTHWRFGIAPSISFNRSFGRPQLVRQEQNTSR